MAAEASRAPSGREQTNFALPPRMPAHRSSLAATATLLPPDLLATAWVATWVDLGGVLLSDASGTGFVGWSPDTHAASDSPFAMWSTAETQAARQALLAVLDAAGLDAIAPAFTKVGPEFDHVQRAQPYLHQQWRDPC